MKPTPVLDSELLKELGVLDWGYTEDPIPSSYDHYAAWVSSGSNHPLNYLGDHRKELRNDLRNVFPEFQSALVFLFSYRPTKKWMLENNQHSVAAYSLGFEGEDYHHTLKKRLERIGELIPQAKKFISLDIQPVLERDLAYRAGLGWFGKNSLLINRREGSYFIIGSLFLDKKLDLQGPTLETDHCGQCTACVDACPTKAIHPETRTLEAQKCISTFTIEIMKPAPQPEGLEEARGEVFGCDICQDVCPWNRKPLSRTQGILILKEKFEFLRDWFLEWPKPRLLQLIKGESNRGLRKKLQGTPFDRPGKEGWLKNLVRFMED